MPRGGHNAKSTADHKAQGTYRRDRHANRLTVQTTGGIPDPPADFDKEHASTWLEYCQLLTEKGVLTDLDLDAVRMLVELKIIARRSYAILQKEGFTVSGRKHPVSMVYFDAVKTLRALFDQFGLTPLARMRIKMPKPAREVPEPIAKLLASAKR